MQLKAISPSSPIMHIEAAQASNLSSGLTAAEDMDLATAAVIATSTLGGFNTEQTVNVADVLAQTSAANNTSITGMDESMKYIAPVAAGLWI